MFLRLGPGSTGCTASPYRRVDGPQQAANQETAPDDDIPHAARSDPQDQLTDTGDEPEAPARAANRELICACHRGVFAVMMVSRLRRPKPSYSAPGHTRGRAEWPDPERRSPIRPMAPGRPDRRLRARVAGGTRLPPATALRSFDLGKCMARRLHRRWQRIAEVGRLYRLRWRGACSPGALWPITSMPA